MQNQFCNIVTSHPEPNIEHIRYKELRQGNNLFPTAMQIMKTIIFKNLNPIGGGGSYIHTGIKF
jgi:hypothetical protein